MAIPADVQAELNRLDNLIFALKGGMVSEAAAVSSLADAFAKRHPRLTQLDQIISDLTDAQTAINAVNAINP